MGKHGKKANENSALKKIPLMVRNEINPLVNKLLEKCTTVEGSSSKQFENYKEIHTLIEEIRKLEKDYVVPFPKRSPEDWNKFFHWCKEHDAKIEGVSIKELESGNFGVVAETDLKENDLYFVVPKKIMITEKSAMESKLNPIIQDSPIMRYMSNVTLAIYLIMEFLNGSSFWKPYLSIFPSTFDTILYFSIEEFELLKSCSIFDEAINFCRSIARQYAYFQQLFQQHKIARSMPISNYFTYDLYRWAVSVIMTRQNFLPIPNSDVLMAALIPLWDMCNHGNGKYSSDYNIEKDCLEAYAMRDFKKGEEVLMFYGKRENAMFFLHNAFVYLPNDHDTYSLKLGLSKSDPLFSLKSDLCKANDIILNGSFKLEKNNLIDEKFLLFLKINVLKEDEVTNALTNISSLTDDSEKCKNITKRAYSFLKDRASLLLMYFKTPSDENQTKSSYLNNQRKFLAHQLQISEKQMLQQIIDYCTLKLEEF